MRRFYHQSFNVYGVQQTTTRAVALLRKILSDRELNPTFMRIIGDGIGKRFEPFHNEDWEKHTPLVFTQVRADM